MRTLPGLVFCFLAFLFSSRPLWAEVVYFHLQDQKGLFALPARPGESAFEALQNYKRYILSQPDLHSVIQPEELDTMKIREQVSPENLGDKPMLLVLANRSYDQTLTLRDTKQSRRDNDRLRIARVIEGLRGKSQVVILPVASLGRFSESEKQSLYEEFHTRASGLMSVGGADVAPEIYGEVPAGARGYNAARDLHEIHFIKAWMNKGEKVLFGICRGHQLIAAALGFKLKQHIEGHGQFEMIPHDVIVQPTRKNWLKNLFPNGIVPKTYSYHHQVVRTAGEADQNGVQIAALSADGEVEAIEAKRGLIWTFQFHPELMATRASKKIFSLMNSILFSKSREGQRVSCQRLFSGGN